jgi:6-phosphogluconolactonase (cycloisomerase 2 family)
MAAQGLSGGEAAGARPGAVLYASVGGDLTLYSVDADDASLVKRTTVSVPANVQYAWPDPSKPYLYVVSSISDPGAGGNRHFAHSFRIDPATGELTPHGRPRNLSTRPIHTTVDMRGEYLLTAYNNPSSLTVHRIGRDGSIGDLVNQLNPLDTGKYAHQIRVTPDNQQVILVTRGDNGPGDHPVNPGSLKTYSFKAGGLKNLSAIQPGDGMQFGPRHLDFHPTKPWVYVSIESQNKLYVYRREPATGLSRDPMFVKETLSNPKAPFRQGVGAIHVHPNGRFVYQANRSAATVDFEGKKVFAGGENSIVVFAINQETGEPTLMQNIDGRGVSLRTFTLDPTARMLVAASTGPILVREGGTIKTLSAGLTVFRIGGNGRLTFARKYDVDVGGRGQSWCAIMKIG